MTTETPCLSGCVLSWATGDEKSAEFIDHAEGCPNAPKPAEPPACGCHGPCGSADCCERCGEPQGSDGSEPPIDWEAAEGNARWWVANLPKVDLSHKLARAYLALKSERDALRAGVDFQKTMRAATITRNMDLQGQNNALLAENAALKAENMRLAYGHAELQDKVDALRARMEALTVVGRRVVKRRNKHYKDVRDSVDALETVLAKNACLPTCGTYEHVVEDQHANGCQVLRKEQEASNGK